MTEEHYLTLDEIRAIPVDEYPFMVFADNIRGFFSLGVKIRNHGSYGHFMWLIGPDRLASQWFYFREFPLDHFAGCTLKLVNNPEWTIYQRVKIISAIRDDLAKPWYKTLYDAPAIVGQLLGLDWFQLKLNRICSETIDYLGRVDPEAAAWLLTEHTPNPTEVNLWTKARKRFKVKGRYSPD